VEPNGAASLFAGITNAGFNNGPASVAQFDYPLAVTVGPDGQVYVADTGNNVIRRISSFGTRNVTTYAGSGTVGYKNGSAADAQLNFPNDLVFDSKGNLFITEFNNHTVRKVSPDGNVSTFAGNGTAGYSDGHGTNSLLSYSSMPNPLPTLSASTAQPSFLRNPQFCSAGGENLSPLPLEVPFYQSHRGLLDGRDH
jgi:streptogramin lyase